MDFTIVSAGGFVEPILRFLIHGALKKPGELIPHQATLPPYVIVDNQLVATSDLQHDQRLALIRGEQIHLLPGQTPAFPELPPMWRRDP